MKITLIFPCIPLAGFDSFGKIWESENNFMPHGLALIAACCKEAGHTVAAIDLRRLRGWDDFRRCVTQSDSDVFGISCMSPDYDAACICARIIRQLKPKAKIIIGGVHPTTATDEVEANANFDHIILGEGEIAVPQLLSSLEKGEDAPRVIRGTPPDLDNLPFPDRELFGYSEGEMRFPFIATFPAPFVSIIVNRGCPFQCSFCQPAERKMFGNKVRWRSLDSVFRELHYLRERYQFRSLMIHDDLFIIRPKPALEFAQRYREEGFTAPFICQARPDIIAEHPEVIAALAESGLRCLLIGFESGSQRILDFIKKGTTVEQNIEAVKVCRRLGIHIFANVMFGLPTETQEDVMSTVELIRWMRPEYYSPAYFTPYPGTELEEYCRKHDLSLIKNSAGYRRNPTEPKIKGVDYTFISYAVTKSREWMIDQQILDNMRASARVGAIKAGIMQYDQQIKYVPRPPARHAYLRIRPFQKRDFSKISVFPCFEYEYRTVYSALDVVLNQLGGIGRLFYPGQRVLIKANLTGAYPPESQAVTHPFLLAAIAAYVIKAGGYPLVGDASPNTAGQPANFYPILERTGLLRVVVDTHLDVVDITQDTTVLIESLDGRVLKEMQVSDFLQTISCVINVPKLKTHKTLILSGAVRNVLGLIPYGAQGEFARLTNDPLQFSHALVDLVAAICPQLTVLDAVMSMQGDGPIAGSPFTTGFLAASHNPFALDWWVCEKLGADPKSVPTNACAHERGYIPEEITVLGPPEEVKRRLEGFQWPTGAADDPLLSLLA